MEDYLEIYSVLLADIINDSDDDKYDDLEILISELNIFEAAIVEKNGDVYTIEGQDGEEHTGTIKELVEKENDYGDIFEKQDVLDEKYKYQGKIYDDWPLDEEFDNYRKFYPERFFVSQEEAEKELLKFDDY
jgi:hypothetical protein|tara:strand:+ start:1912 stop:2307 length:396 start_codon:yes stop_codon:yes gene_type:complete